MVVSLVAAAGCTAADEVVLTVQGRAPGAVTMFVRLVDSAGPQPPRSVGTAAQPVALPATVHVHLSPPRRMGVAIWLTNAREEIVAVFQSARCFDPDIRSNYLLEVGPAPDGWTIESTDRCRCSVTLGARMCPPTAGLPGDAGVAPEDATPGVDTAADAGVDATPGSFDLTPEA